MPIDKNGKFSTKKSDGRGAFPRRYIPAVPPSNLRGWDLKNDQPKIVQLVWHHVISWNVMREVWNYLVEKKVWDILQLYLNMVQPNSEEVLSHIKDGSLSSDERDTLDENVTWPAWNIVQGPEGSSRYDDPESGYENFTIDSNRVVSPPREATYLAATEALGRSIAQFMDALNQQKLTEARLARQQSPGQMLKASKERSPGPASPASPPFPMSPDDKKNSPPGSVPEGALNALKGAFVLQAPQLSQVRTPLYYLEKMWVFQGGQFAISGSDPRGVKQQRVEEQQAANAARLLAQNSEAEIIECFKCKRSYFAADGKSPPSAARLAIKVQFPCKECKRMRRFVDGT